MAEVNLPTREELELKYTSKSTTATADKEQIKPLVKNPVVRKKKSLGKRFAEMFIGKDVEDIKEYILFTAVVPTIQNIICDIPQLIFFGRAAPRGPYDSYYDLRRPMTNYSKISFGDKSKTQTNMYGQPLDRKNYMFDDVIFATSAEAAIIRDHMMDIVQRYGYITVAQLNDMMRVKSEFTDYDWGWRSLTSCGIRQVREGYLLDLPKVIYLK